MKITLVHIRNFMGVGEAKLSLADKGLVLIQGQNLDDTSQNSNGAGKSSLADAIFWCLYGKTARDGLGADEVVNTIAKKDCLVEIVAEDDDGSFYTIKRWRKLAGAPKKNGCSISYTTATGAVIDKTGGTDAITQQEIDQAIGCSEEVCAAAVYAGQDKLPNLPAMSDKPLKELIEEASGVTTLIKAYELARQRLRDHERASDSWRLDHVRLERVVQDAQTRLSDLTTRRDSFASKRAGEVAALKADLNDAVGRARTKKAERDSIDPTRIEADIAALDAKINAVHDENEEESRLLNAERDVAGRRITMETTYKRAADDARAKRAELDKIKDKVGTPCSTCGKPYEEHDLSSVSHIATEGLRTLVEKAREIGQDVSELKRLETDAQTVLATFRASKTDIRATVEERKRLATLLAVRTTADQAFTHESHVALRLKKSLEDKQAEENPFIALVEKCDEELKSAIDDHRASEIKGAELEKAVMVGKDVCKVFGPAGVRAHILDTVTPLLNDRTAEYLGVLSDGRISAIWSTLVADAKGELKEKFAITVEKDGAGGSFAALSGGEKRKVRLACALALQDLVASRATKPLALFIADEIDDALDASGLERLMSILENKARERGTLLVISHNSLRDWIRDVCEVTMKGGTASVTGALEPT